MGKKIRHTLTLEKLIWEHSHYLQTLSGTCYVLDTIIKPLQILNDYSLKNIK